MNYGNPNMTDGHVVLLLISSECLTRRMVALGQTMLDCLDQALPLLKRL